VELVERVANTFYSLPSAGQLIIVYVILQSLDVSTGTLAAYRTQTLSSKLSWRGTARKALTLLAIAAAATMELVMPRLPVPGPVILIPVLIWFIFAELLSIVENLKRGDASNPVLTRLANHFLQSQVQPPTPATPANITDQLADLIADRESPRPPGSGSA
jgi:toxin secretion/phage lysis holin